MSALTEALVAAQLELPITLERDSQGVGYRYTGLDQVLAVIRPIAAKHGLAITQWPSYVVTADGLRPTLMTKIEHVSGESRDERCPLYVTDKTMQGLGAAITYARRYALTAIFGLASEEDTDGTLYKDAEDVPF